MISVLFQGKPFNIIVIQVYALTSIAEEAEVERLYEDLEELKNKHTQTNNTITEIKNTLEGINSRISEAEE